MRTGLLLSFVLATVVAAWPAAAQRSAPPPPSGAQAVPGADPALRQIEALPWQTASGDMAGVARIALSPDIRFLDDNATRRFLELNGNPPRGTNYTIAPRTLDWFAILGFDRSGYVRDGDQLDADWLLRTLREQNEAGLQERRRLGMPLLRIDGWAVPPHYDIETRRLEWATRLLDEQNQVTVNYTVRILGRSGVMTAVLVSDPDALAQDIRAFKTVLRGFAFVAGERYAEFRQGDRVAEYGLAGLIVGGAAAAAASSGIFKGLGKAIGFIVLGGIAAVAAFFRRLFRRR